MFLSYSKRVFFEELNSLFSQDVGTLFNTSAAEGHSSFLTLETSVDKSLPSQLKIDENSSGCVLVHFKECFCASNAFFGSWPCTKRWSKTQSCARTTSFILKPMATWFLASVLFNACWHIHPKFNHAKKTHSMLFSIKSRTIKKMLFFRAV